MVCSHAVPHAKRGSAPRVALYIGLRRGTGEVSDRPRRADRLRSVALVAASRHGTGTETSDPVPIARFLRTLSFGGAGTSFAILLGVLQIGASDTDLKLAVGISAFFMPVAIAAGVLCDLTVLARDAVVRQWTAGRA